MTSPSLALTVVDSLDDVSEEEWQSLAGTNPFVGYRLLRLLQETGCVGEEQGWYPRYLLVREGERLVGAAPCFLKTHSRGEFVFDQGWAEAFHRHGLQYYPKLVVASPFTPVQGPRLLASSAEIRLLLARALRALCEQLESSSVHALFVEEDDRQVLQEAGFLVREGVQFHWQNKNYASVDDFLAELAQDKRKKLRQDSKYVAAAGITYTWLEGSALTEEHLRFFYQCYEKTYEEHWSRPYLSWEFFQRSHLDRTLHFVLVLGSRDGVPVASALNVKGDGVLYGRYWGSMDFVKGLHFETCYLQAIRYCISNGVQVFEGGAQGEHKMSRGLMPVRTFSAHYVQNRSFAVAIEDFLQRETTSVEGYVSDLTASSPFRHS